VTRFVVRYGRVRDDRWQYVDVLWFVDGKLRRAVYMARNRKAAPLRSRRLRGWRRELAELRREWRHWRDSRVELELAMEAASRDSSIAVMGSISPEGASVPAFGRQADLDTRGQPFQARK
jgi:hypothetical protein